MAVNAVWHMPLHWPPRPCRLVTISEELEMAADADVQDFLCEVYGVEKTLGYARKRRLLRRAIMSRYRPNAPREGGIDNRPWSQIRRWIKNWPDSERHLNRDEFGWGLTAEDYWNSDYRVDSHAWTGRYGR